MAVNSIRKSISFNKKDQKLLAWRHAVLNTPNTSFSYLVTAAINHYLIKNSYMLVGKIMWPETPMKSAVSTLVIAEGSKAFSWVQELTGKPELNHKISNIVKEILENSVQVIDKKEDIFIPSYLNIETMQYSLPQKTVLIPSDKPVIKSPIENTLSVNKEKADSSTLNKTIQNTLSESDAELLSNFMNMQTK